MFVFTVYLNIALTAKRSGDFDFIIVDLENVFDEKSLQFLDAADRVVVVLNQSEAATYAVNNFVSNVNVHGQEKYFFVCNEYDKNAKNALSSGAYELKFNINEYIEKINAEISGNIEELSNIKGIRKLSVLFE